MSGVKRSTAMLAAERQAHLNAANDARHEHEQLHGLRAEAQRALEAVNAEQEGACQEECGEVRDWLASSEPVAAGASTSMESNSAEALRSTRDRLRQVREAGRGRLAALTVASTQEGEKREISGRLAAVRQNLAENRDLVSRWDRAGTRLTKWEEQLQAIESGLELSGGSAEERAALLKKADRRVAGVAAALETQVAADRALDAKEQKRQYVLEALVNTCHELYGSRTDPTYHKPEPHLETEGDLHSAYVFSVNTYQHGRLTVRVNLEDIVIESPIPDDKTKLSCYEEVDGAFREALLRRDVKTKFRREGDEKVPIGVAVVHGGKDQGKVTVGQRHQGH
jgi:hypothetical protein